MMKSQIPTLEPKSAALAPPAAAATHEAEEPSPGEKAERQKEIVRRNTEVISELQRKTLAAQTPHERAADRITLFSGSMVFVYLHVVWFGLWILLNTGVINFPPLTGFDPFPFGLLTLAVSLEAIFLSTFVLISQNRQARIAERRTELDLQVNLLAEQKASKVIEMLDRVIEQLNAMNNSFYVPRDAEVAALEVSPAPEDVMKVIESSVEEETDKVKEQVEAAVESVSGEVKAAREDIDRFGDQVERLTTDVRQIKDKTDERE
jgi:uncharacterized membrane protein